MSGDPNLPETLAQFDKVVARLAEMAPWEMKGLRPALRWVRRTFDTSLPKCSKCELRGGDHCGQCADGSSVADWEE
jgi:hypothetical protein